MPKETDLRICQGQIVCPVASRGQQNCPLRQWVYQNWLSSAGRKKQIEFLHQQYQSDPDNFSRRCVNLY